MNDTIYHLSKKTSGIYVTQRIAQHFGTMLRYNKKISCIFVGSFMEL